MTTPAEPTPTPAPDLMQSLQALESVMRDTGLTTEQRLDRMEKAVGTVLRAVGTVAELMVVQADVVDAQLEQVVNMVNKHGRALNAAGITDPEYNKGKRIITLGEAGL
jgi:regulator of RNase E activity RraB